MATTQRYIQVQYDIPIVRVPSKRHPGRYVKQSVVPNPSVILRRFAFRSTKSIWVMPEEYRPQKLLDRWAEVNRNHGWDGEQTGIVVDVLPFASDKEAVERLLRLAERQLRKALDEVQGTCLDGLKDATNRLESDDDPQAHERFNRRVANITRTASKALKDAERAANVFGIDTLAKPQEDAMGMVQAMRANAQMCAMLYGASAIKVRGTILERAALDGDLPIEVMSDYITDTNGEDMSEIVECFNLLRNVR